MSVLWGKTDLVYQKSIFKEVDKGSERIYKDWRNFQK